MVAALEYNTPEYMHSTVFLPNEALRLFKLDERQLRALRSKRVLRNHDARINDGADIRAIAHVSTEHVVAVPMSKIASAPS